MVQESTNTFSDGLVKDLNPLTTPNTVLTDALNATLLTYNGNELVLQNDLGNTKITGAKLPEGYIPLGIKEYGGILYIISSNGENVEIGSFPSPEMINSSLNGIDPLLLNIFTNSNNEINKNIKLSTSSFKPGENFLIILDTIQGGANNSTGESFISDYITRKIYKPKLISIANGVELDITNTLVQQKNINSNPDYYSWFIDGNLSESDINLFKSEKITQIYKSRKSGEIYLRFDLESIDKFYLNNVTNNAYPVISRDESGDYHLKFSFYLEHDSYIKCNEVSLKYTLTDLTSGISTTEIKTIILGHPFISGLTYDINSIVYDNGIYYKALNLNINEPLSNTLIWQNLGNYLSASTTLSPEIILKEYSEDNQSQYNDVFDINFGDSRNKLINYEITPLNTLFDISFDNFTIIDNLDLSKDNISWALSPYWSIYTKYYTCETKVVNLAEEVFTGYILYNMIGRFGENSSGESISLDRNDLPLENNSKQAVWVRVGTSDIEYQNYDIVGYYTLDSNFRPIFSSGENIQISDNDVFRKQSALCESKVRINLNYNEIFENIESGFSASWPNWMVGNKAATFEMNESFKENYKFIRSSNITAVYASAGNLLMSAETPPYYDDFGSIVITPKVMIVDEKWTYDPIYGWVKGSSINVGYFNIPPIELNNSNISTGDINTYPQSIVNDNETGGLYNAGIIYIRKLGFIEPYQLTYDSDKLLQAPTVNIDNEPDLPPL